MYSLYSMYSECARMAIGEVTTYVIMHKFQNLELKLVQKRSLHFLFPGALV